MKKVLIITILVFVIGGFWLYEKEVNQGGKILPFTKTWTYEEAFRTALKESDPSICKKINQSHTISDFGISANEAKEYCKSTYAIKKVDLDYCLSLSAKRSSGSVSTQDVCVREMAKQINDPEVCELMPSNDYISLCKNMVKLAHEPIDLAKCEIGEQRSFAEVEEVSKSLSVKESQSSVCVLVYVEQYAGIYTQYECPLPITSEEVSITTLNVTEFCQEVETRPVWGP